MNLLLALDNSQGINSFVQFSTVSIGGIIIIIICIFLWLTPTLILSRAIKSLSKPQNKKMGIASENDVCFELDSGVRVLKKWYDSDNDYYVCDYGYYLPIRNYANLVIYFVFIRK